MKVLSVVAVAFLLMAGTVLAQQQSAMASKSEVRTGSSSMEQQLKDLENRWTKAALAADGDALAPMLSEDFINIDSDGSIHNKQQTVDRTKKAKWQVNEISELQVNTHGNTAVVTGTWTGKGVDSTGKTIDGTERWADTWMKQNGKWQCIASASAPVK